LDIHGLSRLFGAYDVYVYLDSDDSKSSDGLGTQKISAHGESFYLNDPRGQNFEGIYQQVTSRTAETAESGNYVVFENMTADQFSLTIDDYFSEGNAESQNLPSIAGIQVISAAGKGQRYAIDRMESLEVEHVGDDRIVTGGGGDLVIGGGGSDNVQTFGQTIRGGTDNDVVTGDSGRMTLVYAPEAPQGEVRYVGTIAASQTDADQDVIVTGNGQDLVLGGNSADDIRTGVEGDFVYQDVKIISVNFAGGQLHGNEVLNGQVNGVAGTVAAANWNNLVNEQGQGPQTAGQLEFSDGVSSGVGIEWGANIGQNGSSRLDLDLHDDMSPDTQNERMFYTSHVKDP
ncbi:MAG: hypothetical protein GY888_12235, partial [Planctomycetaceae bacterium]|nr:hypothetical protein [Planctomycetaceae bacterium]